MPSINLVITGKNLSKEATEQLKRQLQDTAREMNALNKEQIKVQDNAEKTSKNVDGLRAGLGGLALVLGAVAATSTMLARSFFQAAMQFESLNRGLTAVMGSSQLAAEEIKKLKEVAKLPGLGMKEALQGSTNLQAAGFSADLARRALMAFGNALATVGKGKADLAGVQLALTQIMAKGKVSAEEINQIAERVPQIRQAMIRALGTADTEILQKQKMNVTTFLKAIIGEMEKLTPVTTGTQNAVENLGDAMFAMKAKMGETFVASVSKAMDVITKFLVRLTEMPESTRKIIAQMVIATAAITTFGASAIGVAMIMPQIILGIKLLGTALLWLNANPLVGVISLLGILAGYFIAQRAYSNMMVGDMTKVGKSFEYVTSEAEKMKKIDQLTKRMEELSKKVNLTTAEETELKKIKQQLIEISPRFISVINGESDSLKSLTVEVKKTAEEYKKMSKERQGIEIISAQKELLDIEKKLNTQRKDEVVLRRSIKAQAIYKKFPIGSTKAKEEAVWMEMNEDLGKQMDSIEELEKKKVEVQASITAMRIATDPSYTKLPPPKSEAKEAFYVSTKADTDNIDKIKEYAIAQITDEHEKKRAEINKTYDDEIAAQNLAKANIMKGREDDKFWRERIKSIDEVIAAANMARQSELAQENKKQAEDETKEKEKQVDKQAKDLEDIARDAQKLDENNFKLWQDQQQRKLDTMDDGFVKEEAQIELNFRKKMNDISMSLRYGTLSEEQRADLINSIGDANIAKDKEIEKAKQQISEKSSKEYLDDIENRRQQHKAAEEEKRVVEQNTMAMVFQNRSTYIDLMKDGYDKEVAASWWTFQQKKYAIDQALKYDMLNNDQRSQLESSLALAAIQRDKEIADSQKKKHDEAMQFLKTQGDSGKQKVAEEQNSIREERQKTWTMFLNNADMQSGLVDDRLKQELDYINTTYVEQVKAVNAEITLNKEKIAQINADEKLSAEYKLQVEKILTDQKIELEEKLRLLRLLNDKQTKDAIKSQSVMVKQLSDLLSRIPFDLMGIMQQSRQMTQQMNDDMRDLEKERLDAIRAVNDEEEMTAAEKARNIEKIERESADKRIEIEQQMNDAKKKLYEGYFTSFITGIAKMIEAKLQEKLASLITDKMLGLLSNLGTGAEGGAEESTGFGGFFKSILGVLAKQAPQIALSAATGGTSSGIFAVEALAPSLGFDNPVNDAMARTSGRNMAMLRGVKFDNPVNDMMARMSGANSSSYAVGRRSAKDLVDNFSKGFVEKANTIGDNGSGGSQDFDALVAALGNRLGSTPPLVLQIDGRELRGVLKKLDDRLDGKKFAY